jgi:hypothetical protein
VARRRRPVRADLPDWVLRAPVSALTRETHEAWLAEVVRWAADNGWRMIDVMRAQERHRRPAAYAGRR